MKRFQNRWRKFFCLLPFCLIILVSMLACDAQTNTTSQECDGIVNVDSCTSSNSAFIQATAAEQATVQVNIDATATAVATVQQQDKAAKRVIPFAIVIVPIAFVLSIISFLVSLAEDDNKQFLKVTLGISSVLLAVTLAMAILGIVNL